MTPLSRGQRVPLTSLLDPAKALTVTVRLDAPFGVDVACFGVNAQGHLFADPYMVFYNQTATPCGGVKLAGSGTGPETTFALMLGALLPGVERLVFTATVDESAGNGTMAALKNGSVKLAQPAAEGAEYAFTGTDFAAEKALLLAEVYRKDNVWRVSALGQGFNGGLGALLAHFGGEEASATTAPAASPAAAPGAPPAPPAPPPISLTKRARLEKDLAIEAPQLVSLVKAAGVVLEKKGLNGHRAKVALVLDVSASMRSLYKRGVIQQVVDRLLALACLFDDDRSLDVVLFDDRAISAGTVGPADVDGCVDRWIHRHGLGGGTDYAPAMQLVERTLDQTPKGAERLPVYVLFITDGAPGDRSASQKTLRELSQRPVFWQFVGVGGGRFDFLEKLDDLSGRAVDNADFFAMPDPSQVSNDDLYGRLMNEYPGWLKAVQAKGWI